MPLVPETSIAATLETNSSAVLTVGTNLFEGPLRPADDAIPTRCVFVLGNGGIDPMNYLNGGAYSPELYTVSLRIVVRGNAGDYSDARSLALSVRGWIHDRPPSGYIASRVRQSWPMYFGQDDAGSHLFGFDIDVIYSE